MDEQRLAAIEARANAATPGPWASERGYEQADPGAYVCSRAPDVAANIIVCDDTAPYAADADFIAAARTDVPDLVAEVRRLRAALDALSPRVAWQTMDGSLWSAHHGDVMFVLTPEDGRVTVLLHHRGLMVQKHSEPDAVTARCWAEARLREWILAAGAPQKASEG